MAKLRPKQLGFDGEEDGWVLVKKQRVIIVLPSLPLPEHFTVEKPEVELREFVADTPDTTSPVHTVAAPSLPLPDHFSLQKLATSHSQAELRDSIADTHEITSIHTVVPSLPVPEHFIMQKPAVSHSKAALRDGIVDTHETVTIRTVVPSLSVSEDYTLQKPAASRSQDQLREFIADTPETTLVDTAVSSLLVTEPCVLRKPATPPSQAELRADMQNLVHAMVPSCPVPTLQKQLSTSQLQAEFRAEMPDATLVHTVVPSLPVTEHCSLQKPATSQSQAEKRDFVSDTHETTHIHSVEPETCPDFTAVDKPEMVRSRNLTTRKAPPAVRRSLQDYRMNQDRRLGIRRSHTSRKPVRFPRVMCSSVVMDNEKLRVVNLEKKVEKAGGLNKWVRSIGLGREFEMMLRGQRMSKFQVANLTMEKLKQMGALAVGPRRKLIHAIHCVYHPHCLRASFN